MERNIYKIGKELFVTSDEEIKEGDYIFNLASKEVYPILELWAVVSYEKKIILTTDQDLIKDSVQSIDDEFLQWFVKNPSCEYVEVKKFTGFAEDYLINIPKEKPKPIHQQIIDLAGGEERCKELLGIKPKQETLEEAYKWSLEKAEEFALERFKSDRKKGIVTWDSILEVLKVGVKTGHKFGAKWQAERMYSETEVLQLLLRLQQTESYNNLYDWFKQFKKK